jgi:hypothetical protein
MGGKIEWRWKKKVTRRMGRRKKVGIYSMCQHGNNVN